jgi:hypothetical protein
MCDKSIFALKISKSQITLRPSSTVVISFFTTHIGITELKSIRRLEMFALFHLILIILMKDVQKTILSDKLTNIK